ncbi:penicillin-binding protein 2 [Candidatus Daviesbacteria bacterium RIFCSPLOWO2_01_FULL_39_12]|uniref:Beta-lactamase n=1 Tax=Candidatus Daviesbacteria bacterium RIFCSPLOWO2_01_FULL_39_12 TaxID=1797785 RepID=A0A1F5KU58_9BACT|nr:MAG: penicillin-binding protein 2 [Candidatus Daviesbacteria bacterium RIFCSPLOWO2_01_FULL_39_12]
MVKKRRHLGFGFIDEISKITSKNTSFKKKEREWQDSLIPNFDSNFPTNLVFSEVRITIFISFCAVAFFILFLKIFHLQIIEGKLNRELADGNRIQIKIIHAQRGAIFDRNGTVLAANSPAFRLLDKNTNKTKVITRQEALELEVNNDPASLDLEVDNVRTYPLGEMTAHVVGMAGEISPSQLQDNNYQGYKMGDRIGQEGIESFYEKLLRGKDGGEILEVDSFGKKLRTLRKEPAVAGKNIYLTIDADLQQKLYNLLKEQTVRVGSCCAAAIAVDPQTGQILALVSLPSFDPNIFSQNFDESAISEVFSQASAPILNRTISGTYPPGSTFKIVSALAALESGKITAGTIFIDNGVLYLDTYKFSNWYFNQYGKTEGALDLVKAIQRSNDIYFYEVARKIGEKQLIDWAKKLNFGKKLNIDLPAEEPGLVPDPDWKEKTINQVWYPGDTLHMAIGQGFVLTTPLQILGATSFIANNGTLYKPQLVSKVTDGDRVISNFSAKTLISKLVSQDKIQTVQAGLEKVPQVGGTAWPFFTFPIKTAGKTGTAEYGDPKGKTHAWYTAYAPADDPKIAMTVLIEGGGEGSSVAAPVVKEAFRYYLSEDKNNLIKDVYIPATDSGRSLGE